MRKEWGETHGLYLLSFLLIHKYFKAFLTHKAQKRKERNRKRERVGKSSRAGRSGYERGGEREREEEEPLSMNISKL